MPSLNLAGTRLYTLVAYLGFLFGFSPRSFDRFLWTQRNAAAYLLHATVQMGYFSATGEAAKSNKRLEGRFVRIGQVEPTPAGAGEWRSNFCCRLGRAHSFEAASGTLSCAVIRQIRTPFCAACIRNEPPGVISRLPVLNCRVCDSGSAAVNLACVLPLAMSKSSTKSQSLSTIRIRESRESEAAPEPIRLNAIELCSVHVAVLQILIPVSIGGI